MFVFGLGLAPIMHRISSLSLAWHWPFLHETLC